MNKFNPMSGLMEDEFGNPTTSLYNPVQMPQSLQSVAPPPSTISSVGNLLGAATPAVSAATGGLGGIATGVLGAGLSAVGAYQQAKAAEKAEKKEDERYEDQKQYGRSQDRLAQKNRLRNMDYNTLRDLGDFYARTHYMGG